MSWEDIIGWMGRVVAPIVFIIVSYILYKEYQKRKQISKEKAFWQLNLWSMLTLLSNTLNSLGSILMSYPIICHKYSYIILGSFPGLFRTIFLTFYQISRLQYCFSSKQIHSKKHGYPKWLFSILYFAGFILLILGVYVSFDINTATKQQYGCIGGEYRNQYLLITGSVGYFLWDLTVLFLYWYKLRQVTKKWKNDTKNAPIILKRIYKILYKIFILTLINEVGMLLIVAIPVVMGDMHFHDHFVSNAIEDIMGSITIYLMIEHNNDLYIKIINKFKMYCCCKLLVYEDENEIQIQALAKENKKDLSIDTKTKSQIPMENKKIEESEYTKTEIPANI